MFILNIDTDGAAFTDGNALTETARILRNIAAAMEHGNANNDIVLTCRDVNGNTCAMARYVPEHDETGNG